MFCLVGPVQRDEAERTSEETSDASDAEGATKDSVSGVAEKAIAPPVGAGAEAPPPKVELKAPPTQVFARVFCVFSKAAVNEAPFKLWLCIALRI